MMQPLARPPQKSAREYVYAYGYRTQDACTRAIWAAMSEGLVSAGEKPREAAYSTGEGKRRWAIVLTGN